MRRRPVLDEINPLQVPSPIRPSMTGMERLTSVSIELMWLGTSSSYAWVWVRPLAARRSSVVIRSRRTL
jgi:hypothetical protein